MKGGGVLAGASEAESPWVPFGDNAAIRHLAFDVRDNVYVNILWIKGPGVIGTHKHRGRVWAIGLEGSFRYLEYDWVCRPGEFITETPGTARRKSTSAPLSPNVPRFCSSSVRRSGGRPARSQQGRSAGRPTTVQPRSRKGGSTRCRVASSSGDLTLATTASSSTAMWVMVPVPLEPKVTLPGAALAAAPARPCLRSLAASAS